MGDARQSRTAGRAELSGDAVKAETPASEFDKLSIGILMFQCFYCRDGGPQGGRSSPHQACPDQWPSGVRHSESYADLFKICTPV